jgi:hypothetical protein
MFALGFAGLVGRSERATREGVTRRDSVALTGEDGYTVATQGFYEADFVNTRRVINYSLFSGWVYSKLDDKVSVAGPELFLVRLTDRSLSFF